ncbi:MAG: YvcK family protein [Candidatus Omnitrophica bacterium]|nr:YvcK family protein [Candidatus Omnitrophota bacterium]MBU4478132.1 YvcK family protein [Candidatus Omnitrophota bacterium]MCG2704071.1 YvcK family protein [Candidatus Omnitrophota bacterium]
MRILKWLYPGMKVKRWILLSAAGIALIVFGTVQGVAEFKKQGISVVGGFLVLTGIILIFAGIKRMLKSFITVFMPLYREKELVDIVYKKRQLSRGPKIVVIGGGTGLSVLLQGLKKYTSNLTAIVTVADDGGSSGRLSQQFDILPPGDIRNCLVALADAEPLMRDLFQFRFQEGTELAGHNFGNLFITVMTKLVGDFDKAIKESSKVLAIRGQVIPSTLKRVNLLAEHLDGTNTYGETRISKSTSPINRVHLIPENCLPTDDALEAIMNAEAIILGPGSLYTSVLPNLLIKNIPEAIETSSALKIYICNVMTQSGETDNYTAYDHLKAIQDHTKRRIVDYCVVNTGKVPEEFLEKYKKENASPVKADIQKIKEAGIKVIADNVISTQDHVRHNSEEIAKSIINLVLELKYKGTMFV